MFNIFNKFKKNNSIVSKEYEQVNTNPVVKTVVQVSVMLIDMFIMFVLIWNMFAYFIPYGSWINIVDGDSMYPTMHSGQIVFTDMSIIDRGDIVTVRVPENVPREYEEYENMVMVKRVIGVPGDRLIIDETGVYVNGELLTENYLTNEAKQHTYMENNCNSVLLSAGEYFLMGDNREVSYDSRFFGIVNSEDLLYKQSSKPTSNFFIKLVFVLLIFVLDIFLYSLVEFILTECVYLVLYKRKENKVSDGGSAVCNTSIETEILKGDNE